MIEIDGKVYRNLEEQVGKNKLDIASIIGNELKITLLTSRPFDSLSMIGGNPLLLAVDIGIGTVAGDYDIVELEGDVSGLNDFSFPLSNNHLLLFPTTNANRHIVKMHIETAPVSDETLLLAIGKQILEV